MLNQPFSVSPEQRAYFTANGHAYIPGLISAAELQPYRQAILDWAADFGRSKSRWKNVIRTERPFCR